MPSPQSTLLSVAPPPLRPGAVIHGPGSIEVDDLLDRFAGALRARGFRVGGVVQRNYGVVDACAERFELVDIASGQAYGISLNLGPGSQACRVDSSGVADATQALRDAIAGRADLMMVNKFAGLEAEGTGLADEMLSAMAEGIPVLTSVGNRYLNEWQTFTGGYTDLLCPDEESLWRWWGAYRLYDDLLLGAPAALGTDSATVRRVVIGTYWVMVETADRVGLASRPAPTLAVDAPPPERWAGANLLTLATQAARSWDLLDAAVGMAALNACYNGPERIGDTVNGLDLFKGVDGRVVVIGGFPQIAQRLPAAQVVEIQPCDGQYPEAAGEWLLRGAEGAAITSSVLANRTLPRLLSAARGAQVALIGPGTPLTERLFDYGIESLAGFVVQDPDAVARVILDGGSSQAFHRYGRFVTLHRPGR